MTAAGNEAEAAEGPSQDPQVLGLGEERTRQGFQSRIHEDTGAVQWCVHDNPAGETGASRPMGHLREQRCPQILRPEHRKRHWGQQEECLC